MRVYMSVCVRTDAKKGQLDKARMTRHRSALRNRPTKLRASKAPLPINTSKKEHDDDDVAAKGFL